MLWLAVCYLIILLVPSLGFFGTQAVRLLRESWDGLIRADAKGNIRPVGATSLAEELFAMLDDSVPQTQTGPVTLNPDPGATAMTINTAAPGNALAINGGDLTFSGGGGINLPEGSPLTIDGNGFTVNGNMNLNKGFYLWNGVPLHFTGGTSGTTVFLAKVVSGSGDTYLVDIYGNGSNHGPTNPLPFGSAVNISSGTSGPSVTATVPQIDPDETIPVGFWISALYQFSNVVDGNTVITYEFQPPVWVSE